MPVAVIVRAVTNDFDGAWIHLLWLSAAGACAIAAVAFRDEPAVTVAVGDGTVTEGTSAVFAHVVCRARIAARAAVVVRGLEVHAASGAPSGTRGALQVAAISVDADFSIGAGLAAAAAVLPIVHRIDALVTALDRAAAAHGLARPRLTNLADAAARAACATVVGVIVRVHTQRAAFFRGPAAGRSANASRTHFLVGARCAASTAVVWVDVLVDAFSVARHSACAAGQPAATLGTHFAFGTGEAAAAAVRRVILQIHTSRTALGHTVATR